MLTPIILGNMKRRKLQIMVLRAKKLTFYTNKTF